MIARPFPPAPDDAPLVVLGAGYAGLALYRLAVRRGLRVFATSRRPGSRLAGVPPGARLEFDLARPDTWPNLPGRAAVAWCFPPAPLDQVRAFARAALRHGPRLLVLGSTSAYDLGSAGHTPAPFIGERAPLDLDLPRVQGEEYLRREHGAVVLRLAGIYGPGRHVLNWIRGGRVTASARYVNLVHVEDVAGVCLAVLARAAAGEVYNVSDGAPRRWADICAEAGARWRITPAPARRDPRPGKRLVIDKLRNEIGYTFRYPDLYAALDEIETGQQQGEQG